MEGEADGEACAKGLALAVVLAFAVLAFAVLVAAVLAFAVLAFAVLVAVVLAFVEGVLVAVGEAVSVAGLLEHPAIETASNAIRAMPIIRFFFTT
ncbi:MAG: hypothetical protein LUP95_04435 [Euryarchaeota archaeon]|nr:hypothetical protein [Euryarchaeota archaeon]